MSKKMSQMVSIALLSLFVIVSTIPIEGQTVDQDAIAKFQKAIDALRSFDATISVEMLDYSQNSSNPKIMDVETNRDTFAVGLGRRFERNVKGEQYGTGVIDWKTASSINSRLASALNVAAPGLTYLDYLNPSSGDGFFLTDILNDKRITIQPINPDPNAPTLISFQLENPQLNGRPYNIIRRIWLDSAHGYLLNKMEWWYQAASGPPTLSDRMQVEKFIKVDDGLWVPFEAKMIHFSDDDRQLIEYSYSMKLDERLSSFNTITSGKLFLASSLPKVNYERNGWKWDYPATRLLAAKDFDFSVKLASVGNRARIWFVIIFVTLNVFLIAFMLTRMRKAKV